jgi:hypothetical protein
MNEFTLENIGNNPEIYCSDPTCNRTSTYTSDYGFNNDGYLSDTTSDGGSRYEFSYDHKKDK